jgi:hypothetical protein
VPYNRGTKPGTIRTNCAARLSITDVTASVGGSGVIRISSDLAGQQIGTGSAGFGADAGAGVGIGGGSNSTYGPHKRANTSASAGTGADSEDGRAHR